MDPIRTRILPRKDIAGFIPDPRGVLAFEAAQRDVTSQNDALTTAAFLTLTDAPTLGAERVLTLTAGQLTGTDGGANSTYTLGLASTAVTAGTYGSASKAVAFTVDAKGRLTAASEYALSTSNVTEGTNLYFTNARARSAVSGSSGVSYNSGTGAFTATAAGTYGAPTGTVSRAAFATYTAPTISVVPTQAEVQAIADALQAVSRTLAALVTDMRANGNLA